MLLYFFASMYLFTQPQLKMKALDGKMRTTDVATRETIFRIIQSIPSPKAEPFKQWFAKTSHERLQEIENPELGLQRIREIYKQKGYSDEWIEARLKSIDIREQLTDEWKKRNIKEGIEYAILTSEISKSTFGLTPSEYKKVKNLKRENLRDHMTNVELIFTMLGEEETKQITREEDAHGFIKNKQAAQKGGKAAKGALDGYEKITGKRVVSKSNFKKQIEAAKAKLKAKLSSKKNKKKD